MKGFVIDRRQRAFLFVREHDFNSLRRLVANGCPVDKKILKSVCHNESELEKLLRCAKSFENAADLYKMLCRIYQEDKLNQKLARWGCQALLCQAATEKLIGLHQLEVLAQKNEPVAAEYLASLGRFDLLVKYPGACAVTALQNHHRTYDLLRLGV